MADDTPTAPPIEKTPEKGDTAKKESTPDVSDLTKGKYRSAEDLAKAHSELESKLGEQGREVQQSREFQAIVQPLLDVIRNDPELFKAVDEKMRNLEPETKKEKDKKEVSPENLRDVRDTAADLLLARFEEKHNIDKLPVEDRKRIRSNIGDKIYEMTGQNLNGVDLRRLGSVLENAFDLVKAKTDDKSTLETLAAIQKANEAGMPSVPASSGKTETTLTSEEADVAERLGLSREQYLQGKKKR